jgi:hypothetical protein
MQFTLNVFRFSAIFFISTLFVRVYCQTLLDESEPTVVQGDFSQYKYLDTLKVIEIQRFLINLNENNQPDTLILENLESLVGDPQLFSILDIRLFNGRRYILKNIVGKNVDSLTRIKFRNRLKTNLIFIPELKTKETLFFIWDYQYPDCSAQFEIVKFDDNGFTKLYKKDVHVHQISAMNNDEILIIKGIEGCEGKLNTDTVKLE